MDHLFDVPVEIARRMTGYRHDLTDFVWGEPQFTVARRKRLRSAEALHRPRLWARFSGARR